MALLGDVEILSREVCIISVIRGPTGQFVVTIMLILCSAQKGRRRRFGKVRRGEDDSAQAGRAEALLARGVSGGPQGSSLPRDLRVSPGLGVGWIPTEGQFVFRQETCRPVHPDSQHLSPAAVSSEPRAARPFFLQQAQRPGANL